VKNRLSVKQLSIIIDYRPSIAIIDRSLIDFIENQSAPYIQLSRTPHIQLSRTPYIQFSRTPYLHLSRTPYIQFSRTPYLQLSRTLDPASLFAPCLSIGAIPYRIESSADQGCHIPTSRLKLFLASYENQKYEYSTVRALETKYGGRYRY
jgi:hypothetical protein